MLCTLWLWGCDEFNGTLINCELTSEWSCPLCSYWENIKGRQKLITARENPGGCPQIIKSSHKNTIIRKVKNSFNRRCWENRKFHYCEVQNEVKTGVWLPWDDGSLHLVPSLSCAAETSYKTEVTECIRRGGIWIIIEIRVSQSKMSYSRFLKMLTSPLSLA